MLDSAKRLLLGVAHAPSVVASARALVLYALPVALTLIVGYLNTITDPRFYGIALMCVPLVRALGEGLIDGLKPNQNSVDPGPVAGGADPDVLR